MTHKGNVPEHFRERLHMLGAIVSPMDKSSPMDGLQLAHNEEERNE